VLGEVHGTDVQLKISTAEAIPSRPGVWSKQPTEEERITDKSRVALTEGDNYR
jgi:hypothetical protein